MFQPVNPKVNFPELEGRILDFWKNEDIFWRSVRERPADKLFTFYEGPPTANAKPGIHHVLSRVFKDLVPRYKTMQGYRVPRKAGWDTHGLPVELEIEKELGLTSKPEIEAYGIAAFNEKCKASVGRYIDDWTRLTERIGYWCDLENPYYTFDNGFIETVWWIFKRYWDHRVPLEFNKEGEPSNYGRLIYNDYRVTPHCPRCGTSLSDHEVAQGYEDDTPDPSVFVKFRVEPMAFDKAATANGRHSIFGGNPGPVSLVAWTTTPWTLPGNTGLAVKADAIYGLYSIDDGNEYVVVAVDLAEKVLGPEVERIASFYGRNIVGLPYDALYEPERIRRHNGIFEIEMFRYGRMAYIGEASTSQDDWDQKLAEILSGDYHHKYSDGTTEADSHDHRRRVLAADYVSLDDGTGIVHIAPAFGEEDFNLGKANELMFMRTVDLEGKMRTGFGQFDGIPVKRADPLVIHDLESHGLVLKSGTIKHTYPFCWRCRTPLLYYAKPSWYLRTSYIKDNLLDGNSKVNWYPDHIKTGRYGNWLENNIDWAFSRERYWGTPLPFYNCYSCGHTMCMGSKEEIVVNAVDKAAAEALDDFHRPYIDDILLRCEKCGGHAKRVPEVADAWFDSGAMPYAQWHYPFKNEAEFDSAFPADFICEAIDQTRGWFYSLHAEAALLQASEAVPENIAYKNVICLGHIQDEKGAKMSKSRGNAVEPWSVLDKHGADATRWYMYTASPAGSSRRFSAGLVEEGLRRFLLTLWNTYSFFVSYANIDEVDPRREPTGARPEIDRWLLSELNVLIEKVTSELDAYDPTGAGRAIDAFVDDLSNWYVRRNRRRFWRGVSESDDDKQSAYNTLYTALVTLSQLLAPFTPFVAEELWQNLVRSIDKDAATSVHLSTWPVANAALIDSTLNAETDLVKRVCSLGRAARAKAQIKVRQPLAEVVVKVRTAGETASLTKNESLVLEELNAKLLRIVEDETVVLSYVVKPNLPVLGKKYGSTLAAIRGELGKLDPAAVAETIRSGMPVAVAGVELIAEDILLEAKDSDGYAAAVESGYAVAVSTAITPELADEGLAREIVRRIQDMRREANFDLSDRITAWYDGDADVARVMTVQAAYIQGETLATDLVAGPAPSDAMTATHDLEGAKVVIGVRKNA